MFNEESILVKAWVTLVDEKEYTRQQVPNLSNLREVVFGVLDAGKGEKL